MSILHSIATAKYRISAAGITASSDNYGRDDDDDEEEEEDLIYR
jgi:hypothetical protein